MGIALVLAVSILYPLLITWLFRFIQLHKHLRLYWMLVPLWMVISVIGPLLYASFLSPTMELSLETMLDYSVKTGWFGFLVIPSLVTSLVCTVYGYMELSRLSIGMMSAVVILGLAGFLGSGSLMNRWMYEPAAKREPIAADEITRAGMWIYGKTAGGADWYVELNNQEAEQVVSMFNSVPESSMTEVADVEHELAAEISIDLLSSKHLSIQMQVDRRNLYIEIENKRSQQKYTVVSPEFGRFLEDKIGASR
ncbi:hypothetical protein [Paenibacillus tengchongensis]|uniref:hypothetical protein n=1 Tax=Paenibacillus tengchongensis TaxID=2608684 RepID=UPI00124EED81|nr:hypothetical protein [Paenibacillus tengchongensis]